MTSDSWSLQILEELWAKRKELLRIYRTFDRTVDLKLLDELTAFLLGVGDELPNGINYEALPGGDQWRLADLGPSNVNHLLWTIASLCRFSCALPFFRQLRDAGENRNSPGGMLSDWQVHVQLQQITQREEKSAPVPPMDAVLVCLLSQLFPKLLYTKAWIGFPIRHGFQVLGYLFAEQVDEEDTQSPQKEWTVQAIDPSEDATLESVMSATLRQLRSFGVISREGLAIPLLYGPENDCFYLSGIRELMGQSIAVGDPALLYQLRTRLQQSLSQAGPDANAVGPREETSVSLDVQTPSNTQANNLLMRLLDHAGSQLSAIREHMFVEALRQEPSLSQADTPADYAKAVATVLHLCQPYEEAFLWVKNPETAGHLLSWAGGYTGSPAFGTADRVLTRCATHETGEGLSLPSWYLPSDIEKRQTPLLKASEDIPLSLSSVLGDAATAPVRSRLLIPLVATSADQQNGCVLELYWRHRYADIMPFVAETCTLVARSYLQAKNFSEGIKESKAVGFQQGEFMLAHELGPPISVIDRDRGKLSAPARLALDYLEIWMRFVRKEWSEGFPEGMARIFERPGALFQTALRFGYHRAQRRGVLPRRREGSKVKMCSYDDLLSSLPHWLDVSIDLPAEIMVANDDELHDSGWVYQVQTWLLFFMIGACHHVIRYAFRNTKPFADWGSATGIRRAYLDISMPGQSSADAEDIMIRISNSGDSLPVESIRGGDEIKAIRSSDLGDEIKAIRSSDLGDELIMPLAQSAGEAASMGGGANLTGWTRSVRRVTVRPTHPAGDREDNSVLWVAEIRAKQERTIK